MMKRRLREGKTLALRENKRELRPLANNALDRDCAAVQAHHVLDDRQPQACPAQVPGPRLVNAEESLKDPRQMFHRDANPGVLDRNLDTFS
jgi:hypothetical protein